jgi:hypothetical protein
MNIAINCQTNTHKVKARHPGFELENQRAQEPRKIHEKPIENLYQ